MTLGKGINRNVLTLIAGLLWTQAGAGAPFVYGAVMSLLSCAAFMVLIR